MARRRQERKYRLSIYLNGKKKRGFEIRPFERSFRDLYEAVIYAGNRVIAKIEFGNFTMDYGRNEFAICSSGSDKAGAAEFYRRFGQSPFRMILMAAFTELKKCGFTQFYAMEGEHDTGRSHFQQDAEGLFEHVGPEKKDKNIHKIGNVPKLGFEQLDRIVRGLESMPARLLPPWSPRRKRRAATYELLRGKERTRREKPNIARRR